MKHPLFVALTSLSLLLATPVCAAPSATFQDVSAAAGITAVHTLADIEYFATGLAWGDYNNDGWLDLYVTNNGGAATLYLNQHGTFAVSPLSNQVSVPAGYTGGASWADYDNDGYKDLYVTRAGANILFHNDAGAGFTDVTATAGVGDTGKGETSTWGDFNNDGYLDLYVVNWECFAQSCIHGGRDALYKNNGDGTFTDITSVLGPKTDRPGFSASWVDYDNDGDLDLYLVNDRQTGNVLYKNNGAGCGGWCFQDVSAVSRSNVAVTGMGLALGDYDNDGDIDLYFSNGGPPVFLVNRTVQGTPLFFDRSALLGVNYDAFNWGAIMFEGNNDGWPDLFLAVMKSVSPYSNGTRYFQNTGTGKFEDRSVEAGANFLGETMGVGYADYDNDGRMDYALGNRGQGFRLFRNTTSGSNNWLKVVLTGSGGINRDAVGARVFLSSGEVTGPAGEHKGQKTQLQVVTSGSSHCTGSDPRLHFGLGTSNNADIKIVWPNGIQQTLNSIAANQVLTVNYPGP